MSEAEPVLLSVIANEVAIESVLVRKPTRTVGRRDIDGKDDADWRETAFEWRVTLKFQGRSHSLSFWCGAAHVEKRKQTAMDRVMDRQPEARPKPPSVADVLSSLLLDSSADGESFADWCANYGSDTDSRKALETYLACQEGGRALRVLLGAEFRRFANAENDV